MPQDGSFSRRKVIQTSTGIGLLGFAGCIGDPGSDGGNGDGNGGNGNGGNGNGGNGGGDVTEIVLAHAGAQTSGGQATEGLRRAVSQHSDIVSISTTESGGDPASVRLYNDGSADGYPGSNFIFLSAANDEEPFAENPVDKVAHQGWRFGTIQAWWMAADGTGIETFDDIRGSKVWALDPSWGIRQFNEVVLKEHGIWDEIEVVNIGAGDVAGAVEEGRVEVFTSLGTNGIALHGASSKQIESRADVHYVETEDEDFINAIQNVPSAVYEEVDNTYDWSQEVGTDTLTTWGLPYQMWFGEELSNDVVYELARVSHEHHDVIREANSAYPDHSDISLMTNAYVDAIPVHSGMVDFLQDNDAWDDSWPTA